MNILVMGSGGREHALSYHLSKSDSVDKIYVYPGNPGINIEKKCETISEISSENLIFFAINNKVELVVIGPEQELMDGWGDRFREKGIKVFGPGMKEAMLEGSKSFSKEFMKKYGVSTASYEVFTDEKSAEEYINQTGSYPIVVKASGLCAGKGVIIAETKEDAINAVKSIMSDKIFKSAGDTVVIEEFLRGKETSILSIYDGENIYPMASSMDHKKIFDGEKGPNTGGMGTISPSPYFDKSTEEDFIENILKPTLNGLKSENMTDPACIFFGLMLTDKGVKLLEYNIRFGDPETQVVLSRLTGDLKEILYSAADGNTKYDELTFKDDISLCVIGAAPGYPGVIEKGIPINLPKEDGIKVFYAGVGGTEESLVSTGGRIFGVTSNGDDKVSVREKIQNYFDNYVPEVIQYRKDIGNV
ncbi:MAG: phosphoribosylamine--glycine ligase [Clostridiaceae bacterium]